MSRLATADAQAVIFLCHSSLARALIDVLSLAVSLDFLFGGGLGGSCLGRRSRYAAVFRQAGFR